MLGMLSASIIFNQNISGSLLPGESLDLCSVIQLWSSGASGVQRGEGEHLFYNEGKNSIRSCLLVQGTDRILKNQVPCIGIGRNTYNF